MYDVVIVGAGPVGSRVAGRMAENGFSTVVLDTKKDIADPVCCTGIIGRECIDHFNIDRKVIFRDVNSASIYSPSGKLLHVHRPESQASIVDRAAFNKYLAELAMDKGAEYLLDSQVTNIKRTTGSVMVEIKNGVENSRLEARSLVIANGFGSKLTEMAGLGKVPDFAMGAQVVVDASDLEEVEVYTGREVAPGFFAWLVPTIEGKALAGLMSRKNTAKYMGTFLTSLVEKRKIAGIPPDIRFAGVALKPLHRASADRILAVGSAAGQVKPITAGGVYYGMLCADLVADTLVDALEAQDLTAMSLKTYDKKWKALLQHEINVSYRSRRFYEFLGDKTVDTVFDIIISNGIDKDLLKSDDVRFDWHGAVIKKFMNARTVSGIAKKFLNQSLRWK